MSSVLHHEFNLRYHELEFVMCTYHKLAIGAIPDMYIFVQIDNHINMII